MKFSTSCLRSKQWCVTVLLGSLALLALPFSGYAQGATSIQNLGGGAYYSTGGTLTLSGSLTTTSGAVSVSSGTLALNGTFSALTPGALVLAPGGTFVLSGTLTTPDGLTIIPAGTYSLGGTLTTLNGASISLNNTLLPIGTLTLNTIGTTGFGITPANALLGQPYLLLNSTLVLVGSTPTVYSATGLPEGLSMDPSTGVISGSPLVTGSFQVTQKSANDQHTFIITFPLTVSPLPFFRSQQSLGSGVYYAAFSNGCKFGAYSYLADPRYIYSWDLSSYEFVQNANDGGGVYLYDFASGDWLYTSPTYSYPYVYDLNRNAVLYYYQGTANPRYFFDFGSHQIITQ